MSELERRATNKEKVLALLQARRRVRNVDLVHVGGLRAMARIHELQRDHLIDVTHGEGGIWWVIYRGERRAGQMDLFEGAA